MKNNKFNIDLSPLYQVPLNRAYSVLGEDPEFWEWLSKFDDETVTLEKFMTECKHADFVYLFVVAFTIKYPNFIRLMGSFQDLVEGGEAPEYIYDSGFNRDDIVLLKVKYFIDPPLEVESYQDMLMYEEKIYIEFTENIALQTIQEALSGTVYTKNKIGAETIYTLTDSPIAQLTVADKSLTIEINTDKVIYYYTTF